MNIAIFCKTLLKGGTEKQAIILSKLLKERNKDAILIIWSGDKIDHENLNFMKNNSLRYLSLKGSIFRKFFRFIEFVKDEKISFILSYLTLPNFVSGLSRLFVKNVVRIGGIRNEQLPYYKFFFEKWVHNKLNDATVFNNFSGKDRFIKRGFKSDKIYVIQNAILTGQLNGAERDSGSEIKIVTVSRFVKQKDFQTALYSFSELLKRSKNINIVYYLIGYGPMEQEIRSLSNDLNINDKIRFFINPSDILTILAHCDIYLSTSLFEGVSNSIMEAMVVGLPVVATDVGDNKYLVRDGFNGFLIPCRDVESIVEKLKLLSESEKLRSDFGKKSRVLIEEKFSQEKLLESYLNLFSKFQHN